MTEKTEKRAAPRPVARKTAAIVADTVVPFKATRQVSDRLSWPEASTLNANELKSIYALLAYVAYQQQVQQQTVAAILGTRFGVEEVTQLKTKDYEEVIRFLVDLNVELMKN